jgi:ABC-type sugar transport system ATPase subunit
MADALARAGDETGLRTRHLLELQGVSKHFGGVQAVVGASVSFHRGTVHGLVGENGAGKSTLGKIIGGALVPDAGELLLDGVPVRFHAPREALAAGIALIAQEIALVPKATVEENVLLGIEPNSGGLLHPGRQRSRFTELNERTGFGLDPAARVESLRVAEQQKVEILRAIAREARLIVMDEPTAALSRDESERLVAYVRELASAGTTVVFISHYLDEVLSVCDTVTVMRNGQIVRTAAAGEETQQGLVQAMVGRELSLEYPAKTPPPASARVVFEVDGLRRAGVLEDISLTLRAGEILGVAGLVGSGRTELVRALVGVDRPDGGTIKLDGEPVRFRGPRQAARHGVVMLPEDRKQQGLVMIRPVRENLTLPSLGDLATAGFVSRRTETQRTRELASEFDIRARSLDAPVVTLSGGNQQKSLFAKWLARTPRVLLADEPTRGVDVGAKRQIHELIGRLAREGMAVVLISSELEEVLGLAHRVVVMRRGRIVAEYTGEEATMDRVLNAAFATEEPA